MTTPTQTPSRVSPRFSQVSRARGSHRLVAAVVAAGDVDGVAARLVLTAERVAITQLTHRHVDVEPEVSLERYRNAASGLSAAVAEAGGRGRVEVVTRVPSEKDSGADVAQAVALASLEAYCEANDVPITNKMRNRVVEPFNDTHASPADVGVGVHADATGHFITSYVDAPRFYLLMLHEPGSSTFDVRDVGVVPTGEMPSDPAAAAAWLTHHNGSVHDGIFDEVQALLADDTVLGVVGGHRPGDPVALLLDPGHESLIAARQLRLRAAVLREAAGPSYVFTLARQGRIS